MADVYLWKVGDRVVYHTSLEAAAQLDGLSRQPDKTITEAQYSAAGGLVRIIGGQIFLGKTDAEKQTEQDSAELERLKAEIAARDYRALKAMKLETPLDELYPGESDWYRGTLDRIHELEAALGM
jgi:hypothetical protein